LRHEVPELEREYLLQEYCSGAGIGVEVLMWEGEALVLFQHRRVRENPATGGVSIVAESEPVDPELAHMSLRLLRHLGWSGLAMVEFRRDRATGKATLMEVNGRPWGSIALPCLAGVEFPYYYWQVVHGRCPGVAKYPDGFRVRWSTGEFLRLKALALEYAARKIPAGEFLREVWGCCRSLTDGSMDAMSVKGDRLPGIAELSFIATRRLAAPFRNLSAALGSRTCAIGQKSAPGSRSAASGTMPHA
jgi:predicted ATP-grasp superfamily ATP-dependent carboligase